MESRDYKKQAWEMLRTNYWYILLVIVISFVIIGISSFVFWLFAGPLFVGVAGFVLKSYRNEKPDLVELFVPFQNKFLLSFVSFVLKRVFIFLWALLFIIPGIIKALAYSMTELIIADSNEELTATEAIQKSQELMHGNKMKLFMLYLSFIGWYILGIITLGVGLIFLQPYVEAAKVAFYLDIKDQDIEIIE
ncbi:DUF975 family protein [Haploplasma axanthum]|uniref:Predicted integral membrane protein n=1 Tax=Haploplasma axanthum TaxID=29552 RepID=A0A449BF16_HAPAX|nr:DUF975 family protein [Haploplasma axanthum]VEU81053.1 Predicted integral membrane protein [Haploplasma axanthum]